MSLFRIDSNETVCTNIEVRESDKYSKDILVSITRQLRGDITLSGCSEMYLTPNQLENLGVFLVNRANEIRNEQKT